ncbi:uncharacterized protein BJ171DRAFT_498114 [Polychytrium aggregatum]|uniref:uncharacterized protein n=1 Tax=Polychytrium aggregatum TaxID=110093 RepID=UPI0022FE6C8E|nr:uncharacterized protein BJ171DRAFT_498114 [Polychytrium aggregatum]KAI9206539.1 hypothetical protein BJ171DRAFT_498114 [Polychytrium aggregatum]
MATAHQALRPLVRKYFLQLVKNVHPDYYAQSPTARSTNQASLQDLNKFIASAFPGAVSGLREPPENPATPSTAAAQKTPIRFYCRPQRRSDASLASTDHCSENAPSSASSRPALSGRATSVRPTIQTTPDRLIPDPIASASQLRAHSPPVLSALTEEQLQLIQHELSVSIGLGASRSLKIPSLVVRRLDRQARAETESRLLALSLLHLCEKCGVDLDQDEVALLENQVKEKLGLDPDAPTAASSPGSSARREGDRDVFVREMRKSIASIDKTIAADTLAQRASPSPSASLRAAKSIRSRSDGWDDSEFEFVAPTGSVASMSTNRRSTSTTAQTRARRDPGEHGSSDASIRNWVQAHAIFARHLDFPHIRELFSDRLRKCRRDVDFDQWRNLPVVVGDQYETIEGILAIPWDFEPHDLQKYLRYRLLSVRHEHEATLRQMRDRHWAAEGHDER